MGAAVVGAGTGGGSVARTCEEANATVATTAANAVRVREFRDMEGLREGRERKKFARSSL
jgi:Trk K+ transport system NAD-binding subunit